MERGAGGGSKGELEKEVQREMHIRKATEIQSPEHFFTPILGQRKNGYPYQKPSTQNRHRCRFSIPF